MRFAGKRKNNIFGWREGAMIFGPIYKLLGKIEIKKRVKYIKKDKESKKVFHEE